MENIGDHFIEIPTVDSTNIYAMQQVHARMTKHGTVYFAHEQTRGKGQWGKSWSSQKAENIILSVVYEPISINPSAAFLLSSAVALACFRFCKVHAGDEMSIKWPNDLYWRDRKAGGILIENLVRGNRWEFAIAGIGLNVNQVSFPADLPNPVSLRQITGKEFQVLQLARELCRHLQETWRLMIEFPGQIALEYNQALYKRGEKVKLRQNNRTFEARIDGVNANGQLEAYSSMPETFNFGEVAWIL